MRPGRRAPDGDDLPVVLLDEDGEPGVTTTDAVELGGTPRRRRIRELGFVVVAVAVVVAVGLVGGGDGTPDEAADATTETTRRRPRTQPNAEFARTSTTTMPRRTTSTTTTTMRQLLAGTGPLLPGEPTGTTIGFVDSAGVATILDLDTGSGCSVRIDRSDGWAPYGTRELPTFWVQGDGHLAEIDDACAVSERDNGDYGGWPMVVTDGTYWTFDGGGGALVERFVRTGESTGREIAVPRYSQVTVAALDGGLVIGASGDMTFVDLVTDERRPLGAGMPLAGRGRDVVYSACPELRCNVSMVDVDSGLVRVVAELDVTPWEPATVSPDGRYVRVMSYNQTGEPRSFVLDLVRGGVVLEARLEQAVFSDDSRWLIGIDVDDMWAVSVVEPGMKPIELAVSGSVVRTMAVLRGS